MPRKVILDVDPGIDDAVALTQALFDPRLEVVAVTAVAGNVSAEQATRNVQAIVEQLDPPRLPRIGVASEPQRGAVADARHIHGADGLGNSNFQIAELHHRHPAEKVICDEVRAAPDEITIVALGPLTNLARAFRRDRELEQLVGQLIIMGGTYTAPGNVTAAAEFNFYCDPWAARDVVLSRTTKTLVPLDVTNQVVMTYDQFDELPDDGRPVSNFVRQVLPFAFQSHRHQLGLEGIHLHDAVALSYATHPELFQLEMATCDVETTGELTAGATVFDRRVRPDAQHNVAVALEVDAAAVLDNILRGIRSAGR